MALFRHPRAPRNLHTRHELRSRAALLAAGLASCVSEPRVPISDSAVSPAAPLAWSFEAPVRWGDRIRVDDVWPPETGRARSVRAFAYVPTNSAARSEALLSVAIYDSASWRAVASAELGDPLVTEASQVIVAAVARGNPYTPGSRDALAFDSLSVTLDEVRRAFRILK